MRWLDESTFRVIRTRGSGAVLFGEWDAEAVLPSRGLTIRFLPSAALGPLATPRSIPWPAPGSLAACHTRAAVHHKTSPTLAPHSPGRFVHSPIPPVPESPSDEFVLSRCDVVLAPTVQDRFLPAVPVSAHRVDHLFDCSNCWNPGVFSGASTSSET